MGAVLCQQENDKAEQSQSPEACPEYFCNPAEECAKICLQTKRKPQQHTTHNPKPRKNKL